MTSLALFLDGLLLLTLASVPTLTALFNPSAGAVLPGARVKANIPPPEETISGAMAQIGTPESPLSLLARLEPPGSDLNPATSSSPLNTPPLAVEEAHAQ